MELNKRFISELFDIKIARQPIFEKYLGQTEFIAQEIARCFPETIYFNTGGYGKSESLRAYKMELCPAKINAIFKVYFNETI